MAMKVKKYFASSMRRALEMVRAQEGPDVMILSNRKVDGGVELVTAVDSPADEPGAQAAPGVASEAITPARTGSPAGGGPMLWTEQGVAEKMQTELKSLRALIQQQMPGIAWRDFGHEHPVQATLLRQLTRLGLHPRFARSVASEISDDLDLDAAWRRCLGILAHRIPVASESFLHHGGMIALLGPAGVGKSTVLAKAAAQFALAYGERSVAMVTTDNVRVAAHQQLRSFGRILGVPVRTVTDTAALAECLVHLQKCRLVLIDTPGLGTETRQMQALVDALSQPELGVQMHLVLSATTDYLTLARELEAYRSITPRSWVLTKTDEAAQLGPVLSVLAEQRFPLSYVSSGQRVPDDLQPARAHQLVARAVSMAAPNEHADDTVALEQAFAV